MKIRLFSFFLLSLVFFGCAQQQASKPSYATPSPFSESGERIDTVEEVERTGKLYEIVFQNVEYVQNNEKIKGFLVQPDVMANSPALILVHEEWGLNENMKEKAKEFSKRGYVVLAVDLYDGQVTDDQQKAQELASSVQNNLDKAFENLNWAVRFLHEMRRVDPEKIATVGWSFGGDWAYQMAKNNMDLRASIMYYGNSNAGDDLSHMKALIQDNFEKGNLSVSVDDVEKFQATLKTLSGDHEIYIYPNAGHGFADPDNPRYNKEAADLAFQRTLEFLQKYL